MFVAYANMYFTKYKDQRNVQFILNVHMIPCLKFAIIKFAKQIYKRDKKRAEKNIVKSNWKKIK